MTRVFCLVLGALVGCAAAPSAEPTISPVRFRPEPIVVEVAPAFAVETPPSERPDRPNYSFVESMARHADRLLALEDPGIAQDINALGEVPTSSWFVAAHPPSPEALGRGPPDGSPPVPPFRVKSTKASGAALGFVIQDARGRRYILKLDGPGTPEVETSTHIVVHRIVWGLGYRVARDHLVEFCRGALVVPEGAELKRGLVSDPLTAPALDELLLESPSRSCPDGPLYRALASEFVDGRPLGGFPQAGVREDDPNDRIPHERRRSLRGLFPAAAWLDHYDMKEGNTLDVLVEGPGLPHVEHLLIDFGKALGGFGRVDHIPKNGYGYLFDPQTFIRNLVTLGARVPDWERRILVDLRGVGWYTAEPFDPGSWLPFVPFAPFRARDPNDDLWGALRMARLGPEHLARAVEAGRYSDPRSARYVLEVLEARQAAVLRWAFARRAPFDGFTLEGGALCFVDWGLRRPDVPDTGWVKASLHPADAGARWVRGLPPLRPGSSRPGERCVDVGPVGAGYVVARLEASAGRVTEVHLVRTSTSTQIVGIVRGRAGGMAYAHP